MSDWRDHDAAPPWALLSMAIALRYLQRDREAVEVSQAAPAPSSGPFVERARSVVGFRRCPRGGSGKCRAPDGTHRSSSRRNRRPHPRLGSRLGRDVGPRSTSRRSSDPSADGRLETQGLSFGARSPGVAYDHRRTRATWRGVAFASVGEVEAVIRRDKGAGHRRSIRRPARIARARN